MSYWTALILAGFFEVAFTTSMKLADGFTHVFYVILFLFFLLCSFYFLNKSLGGIPLGTAYAVWTGIGACGTAIIGVMFFNDPASMLRMFFIVMLISAIVGLKIFS